MISCKKCNKKFESGKELVSHLVREHLFTLENVYEYFSYSFETGGATCPICGTNFKISSKQKWKHKKGISKGIGCCLHCSRVLLMIFEGSPFSKPEVREKAKKTLFSKEVVNSKEKLDEAKRKAIQEKRRKTCLEKYGVEHPAQSKVVQEKMRKSNLAKYGVEHPAQSKVVRDKMIKTTLERFGVENASQSKAIKDKRKQTMLDRYGVEHVSQVSGVVEKAQAKMEQTNLEKYGVKSPAQNPEIFEKMKQTNLEKYGVEYSVSSEQVKQKAKETNLERYGVENAFESPEIRERAKQANLKKYGVEFASQSEEVKNKIRNTNLEKYGVEYFCQHEKCNNENGFRISKVNKRFKELLESNNIESELEFIIDNSGYDLKIGDTLLEINPYFTHNITKGPCFGKKERSPISFDYHLQKTLVAKDNGFECVHMFDWDSPDKILNLFKEKQIIYARSCAVQSVPKSLINEFLNENHLQGNTKTFQFAYGLFKDKELVQVMTFGKPRYNRNYKYELLRLCTKSGFKVVGGASKLLKHFESQEKPESIISYCDFSKFSGSVYKQLGFELQTRTAPAKHWYNPKTKKHITDNLLRQRGFDQLHKTNFGKGTNNEDLMRAQGYVEIFDCGQLVFVKNS